MPNIVLDLFLLRPQVFCLSLAAILLLVVLDHQALVLHPRNPEDVEPVVVDLYEVHDGTVFDAVEERHLVEEGGLFEAEEEERLPFPEEGVTGQHLQLASEQLQRLLLLELALTAVPLIPPHPQVILQSDHLLDILKGRQEALHCLPLLHPCLLHLVPNHHRKPFLRIPQAGLLDPEILEIDEVDEGSDVVGLARVEKVGKFDEQLQQCLSIQPASSILHILLECLEAFPGNLRPLTDIMPYIGQKLAITLHQCCQLGIALELRVLRLHNIIKKPPQPRIELGSPA